MCACFSPMQIRVSSSPKQVCYNWQAGQVVSGSLASAQGFFNLVRPCRCICIAPRRGACCPCPLFESKLSPLPHLPQDALSPISCPGGPPAPPSNAPCKNAGEQCYYDSECCQGAVATICVADRAAAGQHACRSMAATVASTCGLTLPQLNTHPHAVVGPGGGPTVRCQAPDDRGSPKVCSGGAIASSAALTTGAAVPSRPPAGVAVPSAVGADGGN